MRRDEGVMADEDFFSSLDPKISERLTVEQTAPIDFFRARGYKWQDACRKSIGQLSQQNRRVLGSRELPPDLDRA